MRPYEEIRKMAARIEGDYRAKFPPAAVQTNAPLALIQVELKAQARALRWALAELPDIGTSASELPRYVRSDGGRAAAGFKGVTGDCVTRAIAIASGLSYREVYDRLNAHATRERGRRGRRGSVRRSNARTGVFRATYERLLVELGVTWTPCMKIGAGCKVHLKADELPSGRLVVAVSKHLTAVIDGVIHDTHDPSRGGKRCVYGYYTFPERAACERPSPSKATKSVRPSRAATTFSFPAPARSARRSPFPSPGPARR